MRNNIYKGRKRMETWTQHSADFSVHSCHAVFVFYWSSDVCLTLCFTTAQSVPACVCVLVVGCVDGTERALCIAVYSIHYGGATDKLLPGQTSIFTQWISLLANLIARWVMGRCYEWAPMGKRRIERTGEEKKGWKWENVWRGRRREKRENTREQTKKGIL